MNRLAQIAMALAASVITLSAVMIAAKPMDTDDMAENKRVVNGEDALEGRYPWVVALEAMASEVFCLLSGKYVRFQLFNVFVRTFWLALLAALLKYVESTCCS